jgi:hypothetical protein
VKGWPSDLQILEVGVERACYIHCHTVMRDMTPIDLEAAVQGLRPASLLSSSAQLHKLGAKYLQGLKDQETLQILVLECAHTVGTWLKFIL